MTKRLRTKRKVKDAYYVLMKMSPIHFFGLIFISFIVLNLFFASIYYFGEFAISNARNDSFLDHFFFSVQTLSTIGYGHFTPLDAFSNLVVSLQAVVGITFIATITGVTFAKFARPLSQIVFSNKVITSTMDGKEYLSFRVGNKRSNDLVDVSVKVIALINHTTIEGKNIKRMVDLDLVRKDTPFFSLSWTIFHPLENSPIDFDNLMGISALAIGHDGTYAQTIYERKIYKPNEIYKNEDFVDVIYEDKNGITKVNFDKFHELEAKV